MVIHHHKLFNVEAYRITKDGILDRCAISHEDDGKDVDNQYSVDIDQITHTAVFLNNRIVCLWDNRMCQFRPGKNYLNASFVRKIVSKQVEDFFSAYFKEFEYF